METNAFFLASGMTNKISDAEFFLTVDYDTADFDAVEEDIRALQTGFNLSAAWVFKTKSGYHAYFFEDNGLSSERVGEILRASRAVDPRFRESWEHFFSKGEGVTLRISGKYEKRDVHFHRKIEGIRPATVVEKSVASSLESTVRSGMENPVVGFGEFVQEKAVATEFSETVPKDAPAEEIRAPKAPAANIVTPSPAQKAPAPVTPEETEDAFSEDVPEEGAQESKGSKKPGINELFPQNAGISKARRDWYEGQAADQVARAVSAACEDREIGLLVPREYLKKTDEAKFFQSRAFFLSNDPVKAKMLKPWQFVYSFMRMGELPFNFFHSHAALDRSSFPNVPMVGPEHKEFGEYLLENQHKHVREFDLIFDLDSKDLAGNASYVETRKLRDLFRGMNLPFSLNFSGSKGFHVRIPGKLVNEAAPEIAAFIRADRWNAKALFARMVEFAAANGIAADQGAYSGEARSMIRVPWSVHWATGCVVKPLTDREFDSLEGKNLAEIREAYLVENVLKGNKATGTPKLNFQKKDFEIRMETHLGWLTWEEMRDSGQFGTESEGKAEWEELRASYINPLAKELRKMADEDPKRFNETVASGECGGLRVRAPEYLDLATGRNFDYLRPGSVEALRAFASSLVPEAFRGA